MTFTMAKSLRSTAFTAYPKCFLHVRDLPDYRQCNWIDDKNRAYIKYSLNAITKDMGVSKNSVIKYMRELQEFGLIMKYPNEGMEDIIYVMDYSRVKQADTYSSDDKQNDNVLYLDSQSSGAAYKTDTGQNDNTPPGFNTAIALSNRNDTKKMQGGVYLKRWFKI